MIVCERCGRTTDDPDLWDPEAETGRVFCDRCWPIRDVECDAHHPTWTDLQCVRGAGHNGSHRAAGETSWVVDR